MKQNVIRSVSFTVVCLLLGVLIALQMKNVNLDNLSEKSLEELQAQLIDYASKNVELSNRNSELYQYISILENDMASENAQIDSIIREKERAAIFAGLREVRNYGIMTQISSVGMIRDSVLRQFVNELRALGAQAISINDERLVATSEIRASGSMIIINGNGYSRQEPFEIKAITNPEDEDYTIYYLELVRQSILNDSQFQGDQYEIRIDTVSELTIPALSEDSIAYKIDLLMPEEEE